LKFDYFPQLAYQFKDKIEEYIAKNPITSDKIGASAICNIVIDKLFYRLEYYIDFELNRITITVFKSVTMDEFLDNILSDKQNYSPANIGLE
jgi:hypothetical protein